jgi:hypothetical protein
MRLRRLSRPALTDRGDNPIPTTIIIAGLAVIAVALLVWLGRTMVNFMNEAPTNLPPAPVPPGG